MAARPQRAPRRPARQPTNTGSCSPTGDRSHPEPGSRAGDPTVLPHRHATRARCPCRRMLRRAICCEGLWQREWGVALDGHPIGAFDGPQPGCYSHPAGGECPAVLSAVGAFGQAAAEPLDLADVGFALVGVRGDREHGGVGSGGIEDESNCLAFGSSMVYSWSGCCPGPPSPDRRLPARPTDHAAA
jgi:hypothetical protein